MKADDPRVLTLIEPTMLHEVGWSTTGELAPFEWYGRHTNPRLGIDELLIQIVDPPVRRDRQ